MIDTNKMNKMGGGAEFPMEQTMCAFLFKDSKELLFGNVFFDKDYCRFKIKEYKSDFVYLAEQFSHYHYVLNENGGFYYTN
jgi:hypothetical protein